MGLSVIPGNFWNYWDMDQDAVVCTLESTGNIKEWRGVRYQPEQFWLTGEIGEMAAWLQKARDTRLDLNRSTGWRMCVDFRYTRGPFRAIIVSLWWLQVNLLDPMAESDNIIGPLPSLEFGFREWAHNNHLDEY